MRKNLKRWLSTFLAGILVMGCLAGCGPTNTNTSTEENQTQQSGGDQTTQEAPETNPVSEPITISILTSRQSGATNDAEDIWFFRYLEYWLAQQGYDVTIKVEQTMEPEQQISLRLGTDTLPDLIWGITLTESNAVLYGQEDGMLLDWAPYVNEQTMPNLWNELQNNMDALVASTCPNGAVYTIPTLSERTYGGNTLTYGMNDRMFINEKWLKECDLDMPTNIDDFLDMLRAFKNEIKLEGDQEVIPLLSNANFFQKFLWVGLGYYGSTNGWSEIYGTEIAIKDGEITLGAYNKEDYRTFIEIMKTCYDEGLISKDYFTMDGTTKAALSKSGVSGVDCDWTLGNVPDFHDWVGLSPFAIGDNDQIAISVDPAYKTGMLWASADTEHPEVLALIVDYLYSAEGARLYQYGPQKGQDPLNMVDGWYLNAEGTDITTTLVEKGTYETMAEYLVGDIHSADSIGAMSLAKRELKKLAGLEVTDEPYTVKDVITGQEINGMVVDPYTADTAACRWRQENSKASEPYVTIIKLPAVYLSEEDSLEAADKKIVLEEHIKAESAKFITGERPLSEIDDFNDELKKMGIEDYINIYKEAYSAFMDSYFK